VEARGGGTVLGDAIVYDPELDLLYIGTGTAARGTKSTGIRSAKTVFLLAQSSALKPETGEYVWPLPEDSGG